LPNADRYDVAVLELDSWQLQGFGERHLSPHIAVFTSFMEDHLNYYPSLTAYFADKAHIFAHQPRERGVLVTTPSVLHAIGQFGFAQQVPKRVVLAQPTHEVPPTPHLLGEHNRWNAAAAYSALRVWGLSEEAITKGFASFSGVPGRLERVGSWQGVTFYNDTTATTPQAALAALRALFSRHSHLVAILGGADKRLPQERYDALAAFIKERSVAVVLLPGSGTPRLATALSAAGVEDMPVAEHMTQAVSLALQRARDGGAVVLTPAFASFGLFQNEFDRGRQFVQAIEKETCFNRDESKQ
jgi:UDP-N-acetylmuramoylalanine--D-glutamate ligase